MGLNLFDPISSYYNLRSHIGHDVSIVGYGNDEDNDYANVAIECNTCSEVLVDFDQPDDNEGDATDKDLLQALQDSYRHWSNDHEMLTMFGGHQPFGNVFDGSECTLCKMFMKANSDCIGCPLDGATTNCFHEVSPYQRAKYAYEWHARILACAKDDGVVRRDLCDEARKMFQKARAEILTILLEEINRLERK